MDGLSSVQLDIASIASSKGISQDDLVKAISTVLQDADSNLSADQATRMATALATGTPSVSPGQPWASQSSGTSSTFNVLA